MQSLALLSEKAASLLSDEGSAVYNFNLYGTDFKLGLIEPDEPDFDINSPRFDELVLVKKIAFSLNFRDKAMLLLLRASLNKENDVPQQAGIGSDFVGEVIKVGKKVKSFKTGDRIIPNAAYPSTVPSKIRGGIPTNHASAGFDVMHELQLLKIPAEISDEIGAVFTVGCQTVFGMIRRLELSGDENVLITSGTSNTSLFAIAILKNKVKSITVLTTKEENINRLMALGAHAVKIVKNRHNLRQESWFSDLEQNGDGFDAIIDPFFDVHLSQLLDVINVGGKYITCGLYYQSFRKEYAAPDNLIEGKLLSLLGKSATLHFNCLGKTEDLQLAIDSYVKGEFSIPIDSIFTDGQIDDFLSRSFSESDKLGKVVYKY